MREIVKEPHGRPQHRGGVGLEHAGTRGLLQHTRRRRIEDFRQGGGVHELQALRYELDVDQPTGGVFEIPGIGVAFFLGDRRAHLDDVGDDRARVALAAENIMNGRLDPHGESRRSRDDASARQRHMFPRPGLALLIADEALDLRGQRPGTTRRTQPHVDFIQHAVIRLDRQRADKALGQTGKILGAVERTLAIGIRMLVVEIVDDDEIEVGTRGHLARAEPAKREDRRLLAADAAMRGGEIVFDAAMQPANEDVGQFGEYAARLLGRNRSGKNAAPIMNICSWPNERIASSTSSWPPLSPRARARSASSRFASGSAPKKLGSISGSITCGCCDRISASRRGRAENECDEAHQLRFCRSSDSSRPPARRPARNRSADRSKLARLPDRTRSGSGAGPRRERRPRGRARAIRSFGQEHMFMIGAHILSGRFRPEQAGGIFAELADVLIRALPPPRPNSPPSTAASAARRPRS